LARARTNLLNPFHYNIAILYTVVEWTPTVGWYCSDRNIFYGSRYF